MANRLSKADLFLVAHARLERCELWRGPDMAPLGGDPDTCPVDLLGALSYAAYGEPRNPDAAADLAAVLVDLLDLDTRPHPIDSLGRWADPREKADLLDVLVTARERTT